MFGPGFLSDCIPSCEKGFAAAGGFILSESGVRLAWSGVLCCAVAGSAEGADSEFELDCALLEALLGPPSFASRLLRICILSANYSIRFESPAEAYFVSVGLRVRHFSRQTVRSE